MSSKTPADAGETVQSRKIIADTPHEIKNFLRFIFALLSIFAAEM
jgi:hypothetical protein